MAEVSVNATWRLSRLEFYTPYNVPHSVTGYGEVLLEPSAPGDVPPVFRSRPGALGEAEPPATKAYGTMPGATVARALDAVLEETVEVDGKPVTFASVVDSLKAFMEKWRLEDAEKPVAPTAMGRVPGVPLTPMPPTPPNSEPPKA
jgi:hypothetical protein